MSTNAIGNVVDRYAARQDTVSVAWPGWAVHLATLAGKLGTWEVFYRNHDLREWLTGRSDDFAAYCRDRDMDAEYDEQLRREAAEDTGDDAPGVVRYCRCSNCGSVNIDPIVRTSDGVPT